MGFCGEESILVCDGIVDVEFDFVLEIMVYDGFFYFLECVLFVWYCCVFLMRMGDGIVYLGDFCGCCGLEVFDVFVDY